MQEIIELRRGPWLEEEDNQLTASVAAMEERRWDALAKASGLRRSGKSCRLRWMNYLRPNLKHGNISAEEERVIIDLHEKWGNKWSKIARKLPGRTDNEIKNYWRSYLKKKALVLDKECLSSNINTSSENTSLRSECGMTTSPCSINDDCLFGPSPESSDAFELLSSLTSSPYETRLTEWISNWQNYDINYSTPQLITDEYCSNAWDFPL